MIEVHMLINNVDHNITKMCSSVEISGSLTSICRQATVTIEIGIYNKTFPHLIFPDFTPLWIKDVNDDGSLKEDKSVELVNKDGKVDAKGYVPENSVYGYYWEVKEGDTLLKIAKAAYGDSTKYTDIMAKNNIKNVNKIKVGMVLTL